MSEPFVDLDGIFNHAVKETEEMIEHGFYLTEPCLVTPLGWYANKYPEIADRCNDALMALIEKQAIMYPELFNVDYDIESHIF
ncbi:hypothetical protein RIVM261_070150 [Rivularia sp. IAM M-261]|nr:hypothetical protein CAL7716_017960 [Calothrix sp. PCC 7716]GJD22059.1 hypothetical protein RIVM261_070150 [Rivularia sp. IAM M-261]